MAKIRKTKCKRVVPSIIRSAISRFLMDGLAFLDDEGFTPEEIDYIRQLLEDRTIRSQNDSHQP